MTFLKRTVKKTEKKVEAKLDEASAESFPASDAPSWSSEKQPGASLPASHSTPSLWSATAGVPRRDPLKEDLTVDVCVVGGGYAGLHAAYRLLKAGRSVAVLDAASPAGGESVHTTAHHDCCLDDGFVELEKIHGADTVRLAAQSHARAVDELEKIARDENIACDFERVDGYLFLAPGQSLEKLEKERDAAKRAGVDCELVENAPIEGFRSGPALRFPRQAQSHPVKYLTGLLAAVERLGGRVYGDTRVQDVVDGAPARAVTRDGRTVTAKAVIVATNVPFNDRVMLQTRLYPYRSYVIAAKLPKGGAAKALYWDTAHPYHYARLAPGAGEDQDWLIVGGEDHKTGQADDAEVRFEALEAWARVRFPKMGKVEYSWSGQVIEPADGLALIGRNGFQKAVYVATGDSGQGTTHGPIAGMILSDLVEGHANDWVSVYQPQRPKLRGAVHWVKENANAFSRYADYVMPGEVKSEDDIPPGAGAVVRRGLRKVAVYRGDDGTLEERSAVCPHLGGIVCWNHSEKSWDCPVHGSRFATDGSVLNGPANAGLREVPEEGRLKRRGGSSSPRGPKPPNSQR